MEADRLLSIASEIVKSSLNSSKTKETHFSKKYKAFSEKYPALFKKCCESNDMAQIQYVLNMLKNIEEEKMTQETATVNVGQKLFDDYVKPLVDDLESSNK